MRLANTTTIVDPGVNIFTSDNIASARIYVNNIGSGQLYIGEASIKNAAGPILVANQVGL
eukprot:401198-Pyramimonas_sp.AAC.1